jgi:branched-chain amino acid transport system ATP-binding protein
MNPFKSVAGDTVAIDKAIKIVEQVGLGSVLDAHSKNLSYGQRRALEIAVALAAEPRVLFLDEPTQGMGAEGRDRLLELILSLKRKFTIVMIEHDMDFLFRLADRVSVIHWGQVIAQGTPDELRSDPWVRRSKLGAPADA